MTNPDIFYNLTFHTGTNLSRPSKSTRTVFDVYLVFLQPGLYAVIGVDCFGEYDFITLCVFGQAGCDVDHGTEIVQSLVQVDYNAWPVVYPHDFIGVESSSHCQK